MPPFDRRLHHVVAELLLSVPGAAPGDEGGVLVGGREHAARIEADAERAGVRAHGGGRHGDADAGSGPLDRPVCDALGMAVGEAVEGTLGVLAHAVQLILGPKVAHPVRTIVREPQLLGLRVPVETDRVAHAARHDLDVGAVQVLAPDLAVQAAIDLAQVARRADGNVELLVRPDAGELPVVVRRLGQVDLVADIRRLRIVELVLDAVETQRLVDRDDVERAIVEGEAVGLLLALDDHLDAALAALVGDGVDLADHAGANEDRALVAAPQRARARNAVRPQLHLEAGGHLDLVERDLLARRDRQRRRVRLEVQALLGLGHQRLRLIERIGLGAARRPLRLLGIDPHRGCGHRKGGQADRGGEPRRGISESFAYERPPDALFRVCMLLAGWRA